MTMILGIALALVFGQSAQSDRPKAQHGESIVAIGCVHGSTLMLRKVDSSTMEAEDAKTAYRLRGSKDVMKTLRAHNGHEEEVTGILKGTNKTALGTKEIGKRGRVYMREEREFSANEQLPEIEVTSLKHVSGACGKNAR